MSDVRLDAEVRWRADGKPQVQGNIPLESLSASSAKPGSGDAKSLDQLLQIFDAINKAKVITLVVKFAYAHKFFPEARSIDSLKIGVYLVQLRATATCADLKVTKAVAASNAQTITLALEGGGFVVEKT